MIISARAWKDLALDDTIDEYERAKLVTWDYPMTDKYSKLWDRMQAGYIQALLSLVQLLHYCALIGPELHSFQIFL